MDKFEPLSPIKECYYSTSLYEDSYLRLRTSYFAVEKEVSTHPIHDRSTDLCSFEQPSHYGDGISSPFFFASHRENNAPNLGFYEVNQQERLSCRYHPCTMLPSGSPPASDYVPMQYLSPPSAQPVMGPSDPMLLSMAEPYFDFAKMSELIADHSTRLDDMVDELVPALSPETDEIDVKMEKEDQSAKKACKEKPKSKQTEKYIFIFESGDFMCSSCDKKLPSQAHLWHHKYRYHDLGQKGFCPICSKSMNSRSSILSHLRSHSGEKPYQCKQCDRRFIDYSTCIKHCRVHSGEKPYSCGVCGKRFAQSGNMARHQMNHVQNRTVARSNS